MFVANENDLNKINKQLGVKIKPLEEDSPKKSSIKRRSFEDIFMGRGSRL